MPHLLKNNHLEVHIDLPTENYNLARFDWTGKIVSVIFKGKYLSGVEIENASEEQFCGKGFYNEFGIDSPLGFDETEIGDFFHKIGIGLLKKSEPEYGFYKPYEIAPAKFTVVKDVNAIQIMCQSQAVNGYAYYLEKEIQLLENGFTVNYYLENKGEKPIMTNEYNHNFLSIDKNLIDKDYILKFPFQLKPSNFGERVNPERAVNVGLNEFTFQSTPNEQFFFSNVSGGEMVQAKWTLENIKSKIGISETGNFQTHMINLWGWKHVISPELFFNIDIQSGQSTRWERTYHIYELN